MRSLCPEASRGAGQDGGGRIWAKVGLSQVGASYKPRTGGQASESPRRRRRGAELVQARFPPYSPQRRQGHSWCPSQKGHKLPQQGEPSGTSLSSPKTGGQAAGDR